MQIMPFGEVATIVQLPWALMKISATAPVCARPWCDRTLAEILAEHADDVRAFAAGHLHGLRRAWHGIPTNPWIYRLFSDRPSQGERNHETRCRDEKRPIAKSCHGHLQLAGDPRPPLMMDRETATASI